MLFTWSLYLCRQRPTLPHTFACSTIGPAGLNFRVRDGNGWIPRGKITDKLRRFAASKPRAEVLSRVRCDEGSPAAISVSLLQRRAFKDRENEVSQLNRLGRHWVATSLTTSALSADSRQYCFSVIQVRTTY